MSAAIVIVQSIQTVWTKSSRGGRGASLRNGVPEAVAVPRASATAGARLLLHRVVYHESNGFAAPLTDALEACAGDALEVGCVSVRAGASGASVEYEGGAKCGAPARLTTGLAATRKHFALRAGECVRVAYNGRFSGEHWWYEKQVVNVCLGVRLSPDIFTRAVPAQVWYDLAALR